MGLEENGLDDDEGSLADFEEEFLKEKKKKSSRVIYFLLLLLVLAGAGYYFAAMKGLLPESASKIISDISSKVDEISDKKETEDFQEDEIQIEEKSAGTEEDQPVLEKIEPMETGLKKGRITSEKGENQYGSSLYTFHVGVYAKKKNAENMVARLEKAGLKPETSQVKIKAEVVRVLVGHFPFRELAVKEADNLITKGFKPKVQIVKAGEYALVMGTFPKRQDASELIKSLRDKGLTVWTDKAKSGTEKISATLVKVKGVRGPMVAKVIDFLERKKIEYVLKR